MEGFLYHTERGLKLKTEGKRRKGRSRRSWRKSIEEEAEIMGKNLRGESNSWKQSPLTLLRGGPVFRSGVTGH